MRAPGFEQYSTESEQNLLESLIIESIQIYGIDVVYLPREYINFDQLFKEDPVSRFRNTYTIEMYIKNFEGMEGQLDFVSKFGLEIRDQMTFTLSKLRFQEEIITHEEEIIRPREGDILYVPFLNNTFFEIKLVNPDTVFFQLGKLFVYDLKCELMESVSNDFDTGNTEIDMRAKEFSMAENEMNLSVDEYNIALPDGSEIKVMDMTMDEQKPLAVNDIVEDADDSIISNNESDPFSNL